MGVYGLLPCAMRCTATASRHRSPPVGSAAKRRMLVRTASCATIAAPMTRRDVSAGWLRVLRTALAIPSCMPVASDSSWVGSPARERAGSSCGWPGETACQNPLRRLHLIHHIVGKTHFGARVNHGGAHHP